MQAVAFIVFYGTILASLNALNMKNTGAIQVDYQNAVLLLVKEKFPSFLLGLFLIFVLSFVAVKNIKIKIGKSNVHTAKAIKIGAIKTYTVQSGDDLWQIAQKMYGSGFNALDIAKANNLSEPYTLIENQILVIPSIAPKAPTQGDLTPEAAQTTHITEYVVQSGDYLWQIAVKVYGDGNQMSKLIEANHIPYPYNVDEGQKLIIP